MRVMTNGCFDIFHLGHLEMLNFASSLGDLFVAINSDLSVKILKVIKGQFSEKNID